MNIDKRFYLELFEKQYVTLHEENYKKLYNEIWLCDELFKDFLLATDPSVKICIAKEIYTYNQSFNIFVTPDSFINSIIYHQQHELKDNINGYIPQDHIIHSINLYILGIYIFFNSPVFHKKLLNTESDRLDINAKILKFIVKWRSFALYHDIGYSLETSVNKKGKVINAYNIGCFTNINLYNNVKYLYVLRNISRLLIILAIFQIGTKKYDFKKSVDSKIHWRKNEKESIKGEDLANHLFSIIPNPYLINNISSDYSFDNILPLYNDKKYVIIVLDTLEIPVGYIVKVKDKICECYLKEDYSLDLIKKSESDHTFKYIVDNSEDNLESYCDYNTIRIKSFYNYLPKTLKNKFHFSCNDQQINDCIFQIFKWLISKTGNCFAGDFVEQYKKNMDECYFTAIQDYIKNVIEKIRQQKNSNPQDLSITINQILTDLNKLNDSEAVVMKIKNNAILNYEKNNGIVYDLITFCKSLHSDMEQMENIYDLESLEFIKIVNNCVNINLFSHSAEINFEEKLYNEIKIRSESLKIDFKELCSYKPQHSICDHGVISAGFLYYSIALSNRVFSWSSEKKHMRLSWKSTNIDNLFDDDSIGDYADMIFSVLIHNIYVKCENNKFGIKYIQQITDNPFSYFCTMCDNLQKWKRPKQLDLSSSDLPDHHLLNDDFDIEIVDNYINIICNEYDVKYIKNDIEKSEIFLDGITNIINVKGK